jgi:hypothetical protein
MASIDSEKDGAAGRLRAPASRVTPASRGGLTQAAGERLPAQMS